MKEITKTLDVLLDQFRSDCPSFKDGVCQRSGVCPCERKATVWAYISELIPKNCQTLELCDFTGQLPGSTETVVKPRVVYEARKKLVRYCWNDTLRGDDTNDPDALRNSVIDKRRDAGTSVIIYGSPLFTQAAATSQHLSDDAVKKVTHNREYDGTIFLPQIVHKRIGRSLVASLIMKEVLKRRLFAGHSADNYEWVQYQTLKARIKDLQSNNVIDYQSCDWLVVDNIYLDKKGSDNQRSYTQERLDAVFMERISQGLPSILVFQFDIAEHASDLQDIFGVGIAQIATDDATFKISLSNPK